MGKDTTAFRERFNAYKNGKSVSEIYDAGLPRYAGGKNEEKKSRFSESLGGKYLHVIDNTIDYLHSQGVDPMLIAGILGNMALESGFNPDSIGPGGFAGTVQMSSDMANEIKRAYGKVDYKTTNQFIHDAMSGNKKISQPWRNYMKQHGGYYGRTFNSAGDAAMAFGRVFERPNEKYANWASRMLSAEHALDYINLRIGTPSELIPVTQTTAAEYNAAHQFQPWSNYHLPDYSLNNPAPTMISSMNNPGSPTFTTPELQSRRSYNNIKDVAFDIMNGKDVEDALMDNLSKNVFGGKPIVLKDGKLPGFRGGKGGGTKYLYDEQEDRWDRVTASDVADAMSQFVVTPHGVRGKFDYENNTNPIKPLSKNAVIKSDDTLWTRLLVEKANNTRTWRSDIADQMHNLGETSLLMSNFVPFEGEIIEGANWLLSLAKGYLIHPNYKTVYHGSPYPFDIKNAWIGTPSDMGLHAGPFNTAKGMSEGGIVYKLRIPKENAEIMDLGRNGVEHFDTHRFYDARPYIYKNNPGYSYYLTTPGDDFRMSIFRKYGMDPQITQNPHPNGFPKQYLHTNNDAYINVLNEEFPNLDGPDRIRAIKLSSLAKGNKNEYGQILDKNYARMLNEEGAKLLSDNGYKVLKYHNANPYELGGDAYMITDPSVIELIKDTPNLKSLLYPTANSMFYLYNKTRGYKNGKSPIHIKPANRGKFTALKKRTGHSASWFKENGTPEQKKMAVFALNAKKWKH